MLGRFFTGIFPSSVCESCGAPTTPEPVTERPELYWVDSLRRLFDLANSAGQEGFGTQCIENVRTNMVECDLRQFLNIRPENITIDVDGHHVSLRGQQEDKSSDGSSSSTQMVQSMFTLPASADVSKLSAHYTSHGHLVLKAPMLTPPTANKSRPGVVPIQINRHRLIEDKD
ncbi:uncharacterized protein LOC100908199 [Galendromus occidentalis]|uniref:Uncharacterized protein LOC100908199 n=1 Tax=Galendromus occidentalis TaxID=34638 RepID=A0AAJ6VVQ9_9ACAR|nr:uncharacterized protein LOC100908199 [Galendromus occidentalis]